MAIYDRIDALHDEMTAWRQDLHAHPETAFEEHRTSQFVADKLESFGIEVVRGLAGTGVVGVLRGSHDGARAIGLRADMDALDIQEQTNRPYASNVPGKMHACGHDGHTTMLLGAAKYLAETRNFAGTAYFIFQPAEENEGGGRVMVEEGLFDRFAMDAVFGMHNWPGLAQGRIAVRPGAMMAASDAFEITVTGRGAHAAMPHQGVDPVLVSAHILTSLQTVASRNVDPLDSVVLSVTQIHGGDTWNVIPQEVVLRGTMRSFNPQVHDMAEANLKRIVTNVAAAHGAEAAIRYERRCPATVNSEAETRLAAQIAGAVVGNDNVRDDLAPAMGAEDFAFMLQERPGSYVWIGAGEDQPNLHSPHYDFNDAILPVGASYWARLVEETLKNGAE